MLLLGAMAQRVAAICGRVSSQEARDLCIDPLTFTYHGCRQFRVFKEATTYGRIRARNWLTVPSRHAVYPFCDGK